MGKDEIGAPEYGVDGFSIVEHLALWWEFLPCEERWRLDPGRKLDTFFYHRRDLLTRASRVELQLLTKLPEEAVAEMFHNGKLGFLISDMDRRLGRLVDNSQSSAPEARALAAALIRARDFALQNGYEPEMIGTLFGLERFERERQRAATTAG